MGGWLERLKSTLIVLGIIYIILSLFLVPAISTNNIKIKEAKLNKLDIETLYKLDESGVSAYDRAKNELGENFVKATNENSKDITVSIMEMQYAFTEDIQNPMHNLSLCFDHQDIFLDGLKVFSIIYLAFVIFVIYKNRDQGDYKDIEHGSADWAKPGEIYSVLSKKEGFILGKDIYLPVVPKPPEAKNGNILVIGGSGSGKSASFAIPNAMQMIGSYIFTDPKGELYDRTAGLFKKHGYEIHVINLADPKFSDGYNPLTHIRNTTDVDVITKIISKKDDKGGGNKGDPFWDQTSEALLKAMIYYILFNRPKEEHNLASCAAMIRLGAENEGEDLMDIFKSLPVDNPARKAFDMIRLGSEKTFSNILVSLAAKLEAFDSEEIVALTSTNTIDFAELGSKKSVLYFITPESHSTYDFIMNIFFSQLFQRVYEFADQHGGALPIPMFLILDEFANIGRIPNFERILSTCRSKKLHISIILQSLDQLEEIYDEKVTQTIMANCSTQLFLGSNAQKTLETFSKLLGEKTITRDSISKSTDKEDKTSGHSYSDQAMARALMTPDELRRLDTNSCIIFLQAMKPIKAKKYWYFRMHPLEKERASLEISHLSLEDQKRGEFKVTNPYELLGASSSSMPSFDDIWNSKPVSKKNVYDEANPVSSAEQKVDKGYNDIFGDMGNDEETDSKTSISNEELDLQQELERRFDELFGKAS